MLVVIDWLDVYKGNAGRVRPLNELTLLSPEFIYLSEHEAEVSLVTEQECFGCLTTRGIDVFDLAYLELDLNMKELKNLSDPKQELYYFELNESFNVAVSKVLAFLAKSDPGSIKLIMSYDGHKVGDLAKL